MTEERTQYGVQRQEERAVTYEVGGQQIRLTPEIVRKYLVQGKGELLTDQELFYFMGICKARGLNPFNRDCYLIKYTQDPAAIVVSIDRLRAQARKSPDCVGWQSGIIVRGKDGAVRRSHGLLLEGETLLGGWFEARPKGWEQPFVLEVNLSGYIKRTKDGAITRFWQPENQPLMIAKVAEAQGLRRLWPEQLQGLYLEEEIGRGEHAAQQEAIDIEPAAAPEAPELDRTLFGDLLDHPRLDEFITATAAKNRSSRDEVVRAANQHPERFRAAFERWASPPEPQPPKPAPEPPRRRGRARQERMMEPAPKPAQAQAPEPQPEPAPAPAGEGPRPEPPAEENPAFSQTARHQVIAEIQSYAPDLVATAKRRFGLHERLWPPTLEGCHRLLDMVIELALSGGRKEDK